MADDVIHLWDAETISPIASAHGTLPPLGARIKIRSNGQEIRAVVVNLSPPVALVRVTSIMDGDTIVLSGVRYTPARIERLRRLTHG